MSVWKHSKLSTFVQFFSVLVKEDADILPLWDSSAMLKYSVVVRRFCSEGCIFNRAEKKKDWKERERDINIERQRIILFLLCLYRESKTWFRNKNDGAEDECRIFFTLIKQNRGNFSTSIDPCTDWKTNFYATKRICRSVTFDSSR